jgi:hypothetical protein
MFNLYAVALPSFGQVFASYFLNMREGAFEAWSETAGYSDKLGCRVEARKTDGSLALAFERGIRVYPEGFCENIPGFMVTQKAEEPAPAPSKRRRAARPQHSANNPFLGRVKRVAARNIYGEILAAYNEKGAEAGEKLAETYFGGVLTRWFISGGVPDILTAELVSVITGELVERDEPTVVPVAQEETEAAPVAVRVALPTFAEAEAALFAARRSGTPEQERAAVAAVWEALARLNAEEPSADPEPLSEPESASTTPEPVKVRKPTNGIVFERESDINETIYHVPNHPFFGLAENCTRDEEGSAYLGSRSRTRIRSYKFEPGRIYFEGAVLEFPCYRSNGSDYEAVYARVWCSEEKRIREIGVGWVSYANGGGVAEVFVPKQGEVYPVPSEAAGYLNQVSEAIKVFRAAEERLDQLCVITVGDSVRAVRGRKVKVGTEAVVLWRGESQFGDRLRFKLGGETVFSAVENFLPIRDKKIADRVKAEAEALGMSLARFVPGEDYIEAATEEEEVPVPTLEESRAEFERKLANLPANLYCLYDPTLRRLIEDYANIPLVSATREGLIADYNNHPNRRGSDLVLSVDKVIAIGNAIPAATAGEGDSLSFFYEVRTLSKGEYIAKVRAAN